MEPTAPEAPDARDSTEREASAVLAAKLGAEAALVAANPPAALVLALAAVIAGTDPARARRLPLVDHGANAIVLQRAHMRTLEAPVTQLLRLAGGRPHAIGSVDRCATAELEAALGRAAGALYVLVPDVPAADLVPLPIWAWACRQAGKPLVVLDEQARHLEAALDQGVDLVVMDARALGAEEGGILAGRVDAIRAAALQFIGIGAVLRASGGTTRAAAIAAAAWEPQPAALPPLASARAADEDLARALRFPDP